MSKKEKPIKKRRWLVSIGLVAVFWAGLAIVFDFLPEEEKELRRGLRNAVEETFPQQAAEVARSFGLTYYGEDSTASLQMNLPVFSVVLIHGLDDPGKVWMNLAPALIRLNMSVWQMHYPNDQPIVDSARFFYNELRCLKQRGISQITIVAHSMGGLASREMLTTPQIAYIEKSTSGGRAEGRRTDHGGTPNHGSTGAVPHPW